MKIIYGSLLIATFLLGFSATELFQARAKLDDTLAMQRSAQDNLAKILATQEAVRDNQQTKVMPVHDQILAAVKDGKCDK